MRGSIISPIVLKVIVALKVMNLSDRLLSLMIGRIIFNHMSEMVTSVAYNASVIRCLWGGVSVFRCIVRWWVAVESGMHVRWAVCVEICACGWGITRCIELRGGVKLLVRGVLYEYGVYLLLLLKRGGR